MKRTPMTSYSGVIFGNYGQQRRRKKEPGLKKGTANE